MDKARVLMLYGPYCRESRSAGEPHTPLPAQIHPDLERKAGTG